MRFTTIFQRFVLKRLLIFSFSILAIITGCEDKNDVDSQRGSRENVLNDKAHIVDTSAVSNVTESSLKLNKSKLTFKPSVGSIILASPSAENPTGVIAKITSLTETGNTINCTIQPSNLNEAFEQLYIDYHYNEDYSKLRNATQQDTIRDIKQLPKMPKIEMPLNTELTVGFSVKGNLQLNIPDVKIIYSKKAGSIRPDTVLVLANINSDGSNLELKGYGNLKVPEKKLTTFSLPTLRVPVIVGGVLLIIPFSQDVDINTLPLSIDGKMKVNIVPVFSASLGFSYIKGDWTNLSDFKLGALAQKPLKVDFDASMQAKVTFLNPVYKIAPLAASTLYAFFKMPNELECKIQTETPNYSLKYKLGIEAGVHYNFWLGISGEKSFTVPVYKATIKEGDWGDSGSLKIDFTALPRASYHSTTIEGITFTSLTDSSIFVNGIPTGVPPRPPASCDKLSDNKISGFSINNCCNPADGFPPEGLSTGPLGVLGIDLSKFTKIESIRVIGRDNYATSFLSVCDSTSKAHTIFAQYGIDGAYTRIIKIDMHVNTLLYHSTFGSIYSIEIFYK